MVDQPHLIKKYNENIGVVDRCDQNISLYRVSIRGKNSISLYFVTASIWQNKMPGNFTKVTAVNLTIWHLDGLWQLETFRKITKKVRQENRQIFMNIPSTTDWIIWVFFKKTKQDADYVTKSAIQMPEM